MQFLIGEIAREEELQPLLADAVYPTWSPFHASETAATLQDLLEQDERGQHG
ncbi:MAG TPA: hypothetical protein PLD20_33855 [Blastocatellia bacterium]|nr:hypothetical protein [Blastocatellia bacterium]HMV82216.1 hypothetical protein [Blastocatellia bacterium]HMY76977.1 hypothetical protein [Blastocatellia bacterium]HMZ22958.1 hypothetical protein [Blastocatellia bacterium]HNG32040.1 hypothetical protein [Blastocatellia bacterium]